MSRFIHAPRLTISAWRCLPTTCAMGCSTFVETGVVMTTQTPLLRLIPPQKVVDGEQIAPLQFKIEDTAHLLGFSRRTVERLIERGELATVGVGKLKRVPFDSIVLYQNRHRNDEAKGRRFLCLFRFG